MKYVHLTSETSLPDLAPLQPFKAVVVIDDQLPAERFIEISEWLVNSGCLYVMAWGNQCEQLHDSVDFANLKVFEYGEIPENKFVMTTWHDDQPMSEVLWFAKNTAQHPRVVLENCVLLHLADVSRQAKLTRLFESA